MKEEINITRDQVKAMVDAAIKHQWGEEVEFSENTNFFDCFDADREFYLDHSEMLIFIDHEYGYYIPDDPIIKSWNTVGQMIDGILQLFNDGNVDKVNKSDPATAVEELKNSRG